MGCQGAGVVTRPKLDPTKAPHSRKRPSANELTAAACPEMPLTGLDNRLPLGQTKNIQVLNDSCSPVSQAVLYVFRTFQL